MKPFHQVSLHPDVTHRQTTPRHARRWASGVKPTTASLTIGTSAILLLCIANFVYAELFRSDSKRLKNSTMDIVVTETERNPRTSVVDIQVKTVGSSVGSSFFLLCSIRDLAQQRGSYRYIAKVEDQPNRNQMLIGFLRSSTEAPAQFDPRLAGQQVLDLHQFAPICDRMQ